jgi:Recombinase
MLLPQGAGLLRTEIHSSAGLGTVAGPLPRLKADGGHLVPWNVRLSHVLCNREDYGWRMRIRRMLEKGMSLEEIAENLNHKRIRRPHGSATWSATSVRKAFVS